MPDPTLSYWRGLVAQHSAAAGRRLSADVIDELAVHIAEVYAAERDSGRCEDEARRTARDIIAHGAYAEVAARPRAALSQDSRLVDRVPPQPERLWGGLSFDVRYTWRSMQRQPAFSLAVVVILAVGIGATTAAFAVLDTVLLRPLPYPDAGQLVVLKRVTPKEESRALAAADWKDYQSRHTPSIAFAAYASWPMNLTGSGEPERLRSVIVSGNFFDVLGAPPASGRVTGAADDTPSAPRVVVLSHGLWRRRFGDSASAIGTQIVVNGNPATVVGVMAADFAIPSRDVDLWMPMGLAPEVLGDRASEWLSVIGRLGHGVEHRGAQAALSVTSAALETTYPRTNADERVRIRPLLDDVVAHVRRPLWLGSLAAVFVFLAGCANAANLMIARATLRREEIAIRAGLGAEPLRIARQLLVESAALATLGGAAGIAVAHAFLGAFVALADGRVPRIDQLSLGYAAILVAVAASFATMLLFGGTSAWLLVRSAYAAALRDDSRTTTRPQRLGGILLAGQVAFALILLTGAMVVGLAYESTMRVDPGFDPTDTLTMQLTLPRNRYPNTHAHAQFAERVVDEISATPGVTSAGIVSDLPFVGNALNFRVGAAGAPPDGAEEMTVRPADSGFFRTLHIPLRTGRFFASGDRNGAEPVAILNQSAADRLGSVAGVGGRITIAGEPPRTVVGMVGDIRHGGVHDIEGPVIYVPYAQKSFAFVNWMGIVGRGPGAEGLTAAAKAAVLRVDPNQPVQSVLTMSDYLAREAAPLQFGALIVGSLAGAALVLAVTGIYGLTSFMAGRRSREFGVRLALGSSKAGIVRLVLGQIGATVIAGAMAGMAGAMMTNEMLRAAFVGTDAAGEVVVVTAGAVLLIITALAAAMAPALRATRIDPKTALQAQ